MTHPQPARRADSRPRGLFDSKYIQHNPQTHEGSEGLAALLAHTEYDFATRRIGFEVFRFEADQAVEHWDTTEPVAPKSEWKNDNGKF